MMGWNWGNYYKWILISIWTHPMTSEINSENILASEPIIKRSEKINNFRQKGNLTKHQDAIKNLHNIYYWFRTLLKQNKYSNVFKIEKQIRIETERAQSENSWSAMVIVNIIDNTYRNVDLKENIQRRPTSIEMGNMHYQNRPRARIYRLHKWIF